MTATAAESADVDLRTSGQLALCSLKLTTFRREFTMVMQVFRGDDDRDSQPTSIGPTDSTNLKTAQRRWFFDAGPSQTSDRNHSQEASIPRPHFLKFAERKPSIDFSEPKPA